MTLLQPQAPLPSLSLLLPEPRLPPQALLPLFSPTLLFSASRLPTCSAFCCKSPPPGSPLLSHFPVAVLCQQVASALSNVTLSQGVRGSLSVQGLEAQDLPCSPCDHSTS